MERFTISQPLAGKHNPKINSPTPQFCWFDYSIEPDGGALGVEVEIGPASDESALRWFEDIKRGIERGIQWFREHRNRELVGTRVTIKRVLSHDIDTTPRACNHAGYSFFCDLFSDLARSDSLSQIP